MALHGSFEAPLVALSVLIAILTSYVTLDIVGRIAESNGIIRRFWQVGGALAMGTGMWTMHHVGMEAFDIPVDFAYDWRITLLALGVAVVAFGAALIVVTRARINLTTTLLGSLLMGGGLAAMHYIGMAAIVVPNVLHYSAGLVTLSVAVALFISFLALSFATELRRHRVAWSWRKVEVSLLLGLALPAMHYIGMAAVTFSQNGPVRPVPHTLDDANLSLSGVVAVVLVFFAVILVSSVLDRRFSSQQEKLAESRSQLQAVFDNMAESIIVLDLNANVLQYNPAANRILGPSFAKHLPDIWNDFDVLDGLGEPMAREQWPLSRALRGDFVHDAMISVRRKGEDRMHHLEVTTTPIRNQAGKITQLILTHRDVTDLRQSMETRNRLAAIVDSSEDAIIGKDRNGVVRTWNTAAQKIFGYSTEEMIGQSILRLVPNDRIEEELGFLERIKRGECIEHVETIRRRKDGKLIHVALTISPIHDADGRIIGASKTARDITERKALEAQLQQSQKMEAIGQLTGGIAHDFNNLLGVILGNLDLLERQIGGDEAALRRVHTAAKAATRGAELTRRLLTFSRSEQLQPAPTKLQHAVRNMIELAGRALGPEIKIATNFDNDLPPVFTDPAALENALLNLAVNARDAMPRGGTLTLSTQMRQLEDNYPPVRTGEIKAGNYACVSVSDTGQGMSRETVERAFEPFFSTKPRGKGTGLGLAMVYGFVRQSGGTVRLYSELGYGTTVTLYLPLAGGAIQPAPPAVYRAEPISAGSIVLVVDDEPDLLEIAVAYLVELGYKALQAKDAAAALELVTQQKHIDLMVTDVIMPGMNGVELVKHARKIMPGLKVIYCSGFSADSLAERNGTLVDGTLLHKPYQRSEFAAAVRGVLNETETSHQ